LSFFERNGEENIIPGGERDFDLIRIGRIYPTSQHAQNCSIQFPRLLKKLHKKKEIKINLPFEVGLFGRFFLLLSTFGGIKFGMIS
jgi:hypothetical protein